MKRAGKLGLLLGLVLPLVLCSAALAGEWFEDNLKAVANDSLGTSPDTSGTTNDQDVPDIAATSSDAAYVVWQDSRYSGESTNIFFSKHDGASGSTFSTNIRVDDQVNAATLSERPRIASSSDGTKVFVVWQDDRNGLGKDVYLARSTDSGATFYSFGNLNRKVDSGSGQQKEPDIVVNAAASVVHLCWYDATADDIVYCRETNIDAENAFGTTLEVSGVTINLEGNEAATPDMAIDSDGLAYVVWRGDTDDADGDIYFTRNSTAGGTFQAAVKVHADDTAAQTHPKIAVSPDGDYIYIVWHSNTTGDYDIYFTSSSDGGATFGTPKTVNQVTDNDQTYPDLALDASGNIHVAWEDDKAGDGNPDITYTKSTDGGASFSINKHVDRDSTAATDQTMPAMAVSGKGTVHTAWGDTRNNGTGGGTDIYYSRLRPGKPTSNDQDDARYLAAVGLLDESNTNTLTSRVPVNTALFVYVNRPLDEESVNTSTVTVKQKTVGSSSYNVPVTGTVSYIEGNALEAELGTTTLTSRYAIIFEPSGNFSPGADYRLTLISKKAGALDGIQDLEGNGLASGADTYFDFATSAQADYTITDVYNYPNPTADGTTYIRYTLGFELDTDDSQWIKIYNTDGRLITTLDGGTEVTAYSGTYEVEWDGTWEDGREAVNGVYFYRVIVLDAGTGRSVERVGKAVIAR